MNTIKLILKNIKPYLFTIFIAIVTIFAEFIAYRNLRNTFKSYIFDFIILIFISVVIIIMNRNYKSFSLLLIITCVIPLSMLLGVLFIPNSNVNNNSVFLIGI